MNKIEKIGLSGSLNFEEDAACQLLANIVANAKQLECISIIDQVSKVRTVRVELVDRKAINDQKENEAASAKPKYEPACVKIIDTKTNEVICQQVRASEREIMILDW